MSKPTATFIPAQPKDDQLDLPHTESGPTYIFPEDAPLNYDHQPGKDYVAFIGMVWDEHFARRADQIAHRHSITQEQWDVMVREHAWRIKTLFNPAYYTVGQRILLALRWLNPFAKRD